MNPTAISRGHSFKGVTAYLANPRDGDHRALWNETLNVGTDNPHMAARVMAATAMDARRKQPKGAVWHGVLSWDETRHPDPAHQAQAARDMLKAMGLDQAQALLVGHNDNGKTHVHVVVNLINPDTGRIWHDHQRPDKSTQNCLSNEHKKMQAFALAYCREHGIESSPNREKNAAAREQVKVTGDQTLASQLDGRKRLSRDDWQRMKNELFARQQADRETLKNQHGGQWEAAQRLIDERKAMDRVNFNSVLHRAKADLKAESKPAWRELFARQEREKQAAQRQIEQARAAVARSNGGLFTRIKTALGFHVSPTLALRAKEQLTVAMRQQEANAARHEAERLDKARTISAQAFERAKQASPRAQLDLAPMKDQQRAEWERLREQQAKEREAAGLRPYPAKSRDQENDRPAPDSERKAADQERTHSERPTTRGASDPHEARSIEQKEAEREGRNKWGAVVTDQMKEQARRRIERERQAERQQGKDRGRSRDRDD